MSAPKVYGFDTGFVAQLRGIDSLRAEDRGALWEHYVLNELHARLQTRAIQYWRDKRGHEVDFVLQRPGTHPLAIERKATSANFDASNLAAFRRAHPAGSNLLVAPDVPKPFHEVHAGLKVEFVNLDGLIASVTAGRYGRHPVALRTSRKRCALERGLGQRALDPDQTARLD